ncbi:regulator [Streptomyces sp. 3MP-14]|uniref:Regulator n=1 Tax=Streptomyces mimosae TaxID=2586635 RepID=A0A5N6A687_9ACTN|nr:MULTISPECIES: cation transporter [Streptomyces]KAB8163459.1 regulator [Streptomyces mimosae]KAB8174736.1 regulator [Streptomyces sp. 3MP-14]
MTAPTTGSIETVEAVYTVEGMTCAHCVGAVTAEVGALSTVSEVAVDLASGRVRVVSGEPLADVAVAEAVEEAGYRLVPTPVEPAAEAGGCCGGSCH